MTEDDEILFEVVPIYWLWDNQTDGLIGTMWALWFGLPIVFAILLCYVNKNHADKRDKIIKQMEKGVRGKGGKWWTIIFNMCFHTLALASYIVSNLFVDEV